MHVGNSWFYFGTDCLKWAGIAQSVERIATGWMVRGSNPGEGEIFRTRPDRTKGPPNLLYNGYRVSFWGVKRPGRGFDHPLTSSTEVKERVELYLYSPSGPSWPVLGRTLPFTDSFRAVFLKLGFGKGCQGFRETKMRNSGKVLSAIQNL